MSKRSLALLSAVAAAWAPVTPLWAQGSKRPIYPKGFEVTIEWQYSCADEGLLLQLPRIGRSKQRH